MPLADSIIRELRTYFLSLDRKNVISADVKPDTDDTLRIGAPDKKFHTIYASRIVADEYAGSVGSGGSGTIGHADTLGDDYLTATEAPIAGNLYPLGTGARFESTVLPSDVAYQNTSPTFTSINVTNYVDGIDVGSHDHSGGSLGIAISHANLTNLSADHHSIYTRWDDTETIIKQWKFSNQADENQDFNEYVGWEVEASVELEEITGTYYPIMSTAQAVLQTIAYNDPSYPAYAHSYPLQIIAHAEYAAITLGSGQEILIKTNSSDTWIDVGNIEISNTNGISVGSTFTVDQAGALTSTSGTIGGWVITSTQLASDGTGDPDVILNKGGYLRISGGGDTEIRQHATHADYRLWIGSESESQWDETTAKFMVNPAGQVTAETVFVKGGIQSYSAGKWKITSEGNAEFENIKARGRMDTLVFTKSAVSTMAGVISYTKGSVLAQKIYADGSINATSIDSGGTGYVVDDILTISGGTQSATIIVTAVSSGTVTDYSVVTHGAGYSVTPGVSCTGGTGNSFTIDIDTIHSASTQLYTDSPAFDFGDIILVQPSADEQEIMQIISTYALETIQDGDGNNITAYKYTISRDYSASGDTYFYERGVSLNGRGSYQIGNAPQPLASGDAEGAFGAYQPSGTATDVGGGWITMDGEQVFMEVSVRTGPLYSQYENFIRIGNLQGVLDYDSVEWGWFIGDDNDYIVYDQTGGLVIHARSGATEITADGITSDAYYLTLETGDITGITTDTAVLYYYNDLLKFTIDNTTVETTYTIATRAWVDAHEWVESDITDLGTYLENVSEDASPTLGGGLAGAGYGITGIDVLDISQSAHADAIQINGYDTQSGQYLLINMQSSGRARLTTNDDLEIAATGYIHASSTNYYIDLGDAAGTNFFRVRDGADATVFNVDSNGNTTIYGNTDFTDGDLHNMKQVDFQDEHASASQTIIDWNEGNNQKVTFTANRTVTFTAPAGSCHLQLKVTNAGNYTITWSSIGHWAGGAAPDFTASGTDILTLWYDGSAYWGALVPDFT